MFWQPSQSFSVLKPNEVHIWRASLTLPKEKISEFLELLNSQEKERAAKFVVSNAANSFIAARGILRTILGGYLKVKPQDIVFQQNQYGKLYLDSSPLQFNLSHSHDLAIFIFTLNNPVGVDVEFIRDDYEFTDIAKRFFSKSEVNELFSLPKDKQLYGFFNCWTRKEAFIKALGVGLFKELDKFSVGVSYEKTGRISLSLDGDNNSKDPVWALEGLDPALQYTGAFAIGASDSIALFYDFS